MAKKNATKKQPKSVTRRRFIGSTVASVGLLGVTAAANVAANKFSSFLSHYLGGRPATVEQVEGSENWDSNYYDSVYRGRNQATEAGNEIVTEIEGEGIVLLKNDGDALPLDTASPISLMGRYAADPVYGGAGSGTVDTSSCVTLYQGISQAGFTINDTMFNWVNDNFSNYAKASITMDDPSTASYYIGEIPWADYPSDVQSSISGTTAVIVLGRGGGEGGDLSRDLKAAVDSGVSENFTANAETANYVDGQHELELTTEEKDLISAAKSACDKVVVLLNMSTTMECGPLMEGDYSVDAILHIGSVGASGSVAVGQVLAGQVNPSGKTTDIWAADFTADPTFQNFGGKRYTDVEGYYTTNANSTPSDGTAYFVEYAEGVYMGYRYYETAAAEAEAGNYDGFNYDDAVVFPFGYGLSYTTFDETLDSAEVANDEVKASVTVTNSGSVAGKQVVEIYYSAPYEEGGLEKPAVVLGGFAKTDLLDPGASQTVEVSFPTRLMASYSSDDQAWVLDSGDYVISLRTDSHTVVDEKTVSVSGEKFTTDSASGEKISNHFDDMTEYMKNNVTVMSRSDFKGTFPEAAEDKSASDCGIEFAEWSLDDNLDSSASMPTTGADNGLQLIDLRGKDYDDEAWDQILDQLTVEDMAACLNDDAYNTPEVESIGKPATAEPDGPAGFTSLTGPTGNCSYCSEYVMAQTWNVELMGRMGEMVGQEALASGYNGWYAPAMNTHRSPFSGRNFEYYSEDPLLAGKIGAAVVAGAASCGCYAMVKHFALNDQESYRVQHICTWATEQTAREIYLRPFEITVKEAECEMKYISDDQGTISTKTIPACTGIMSSFNYVGAEWAGGRKSLLTDLLRTEWGFRGSVITDFNLYGYMNKNQALAAGGDLELTYSAMTGEYEGTNSATVVNQLRNGMHNVLYTVANSNAMQGLVPGSKITYGLANWQKALYGGSAALIALAAFFGYKAHKNHKLWKAEQAAAGGDGVAEDGTAADKDASVASKDNSTPDEK